MRLLLTAGEAHEAPQAKALLEGFDVEQVLGDKAYDSDDSLHEVEAMGATAVIPPRANRLEQRTYDKELYKERHLVECFIGKLKHFRRYFSLRQARQKLPLVPAVRFHSHLVALKCQQNLMS